MEELSLVNALRAILGEYYYRRQDNPVDRKVRIEVCENIFNTLIRHLREELEKIGLVVDTTEPSKDYGFRRLYTYDTGSVEIVRNDNVVFNIIDLNTQ